MIMGMTVVGLVMGTHVLEDIKIAVPYRVAVAITADQMIHSKDLYRALNQGFIFKLDGGSVSPAIPAAERRSSEDVANIARLEQENKELRRRVDELARKNDGLQNAMAGMGTHLEGVMASLGRLEKQASGVAVTQAHVDLSPILKAIEARGGTLREGPAANPEVVGGEVPMFVPGEIKPRDAETSITVETTTQKSAAGSALKKLRELRSKPTG